jgi:hypothetical protein
LRNAIQLLKSDRTDAFASALAGQREKIQQQRRIAEQWQTGGRSSTGGKSAGMHLVVILTANQTQSRTVQSEVFLGQQSLKGFQS